MDLLPEITEENVDKIVIFSHNDPSERNTLVIWEDPEKCTGLKEAVLIDFESSRLNYRGIDLGAYLCEATDD